MEGTIVLALLGTMMILTMQAKCGDMLCPYSSKNTDQNCSLLVVMLCPKNLDKIVHFWWSCFVQKIRTKLSTFGGHALSTSKQMRTKLSAKSRDNVDWMCFVHHYADIRCKPWFTMKGSNL
ncbi:hypothetical protein RclHR1_14700001 [Rhizophagus clarus]|uniref:Secreted protein n=1 Tax=Rhizophagus clarus TaxID=94130 RepID=A0A2Z6QQS2_9GLOM|nr:hypothetical protein RclHR1_14700001 [Rhizophagus clarus]GES73536.1 hypothetical protein RCL_e2430_RclHR1_14700001 [Rhizophagus clarus]